MRYIYHVDVKLLDPTQHARTSPAASSAKVALSMGALSPSSGASTGVRCGVLGA